MRSPILDYLDSIIATTEHVDSGSTADYIPELAAADPTRAASALCTSNGTVYASGDADHEFSIQSMSKPFAYALAIEDHGLEYVLDRIGVEPSGDAFNELSLDPETGKPRNPMINAGAITTHSLINSEGEKTAGALPADPTESVTGYIRQCAASVTVSDLALMAATLANGGVQPKTGKQLLCRRTNRHLLSVMASCGMYDAAGNWLTTVGIPAKSGVAGGIIGVLPGQIGVAVFSPRLDAHGNSARGVAMMELLSEDMGLHLMEATRPSRSSLRETQVVSLVDGTEATIYVLQGDLVLSSIESLVQEIVTHPPGTDLVVFDMSRVDEVMPVAERTSSETAAKLIEEGYWIIVVDPEGTVENFADSHGRTIERWTPEQLSDAVR